MRLTLAARPSTPRRSFGFQRAEILAAFVNGLTLVIVSGWIVWEAVQRFRDPPEILGGWMLVVALAGLAVNGISAVILLRSEGESLNVEAALRHVIADLLGSAGVLVAAVIILATGWTVVDPIVSVAIALLIVASAWSVLRDSTAILMEETPPDIDAGAVAQAIVSVPGVSSVHDLHVWRITSGFDALAAHVLVGRGEDCHGLRREIERRLESEFDITHTTLQVDHDASEALIELQRHRRDAPGLGRLLRLWVRRRAAGRRPDFDDRVLGVVANGVVLVAPELRPPEHLPRVLHREPGLARRLDGAGRSRGKRGVQRPDRLGRRETRTARPSSSPRAVRACGSRSGR